MPIYDCLVNKLEIDFAVHWAANAPFPPPLFDHSFIFWGFVFDTFILFVLIFMQNGLVGILKTFHFLQHN